MDTQVSWVLWSQGYSDLWVLKTHRYSGLLGTHISWVLRSYGGTQISWVFRSHRYLGYMGTLVSCVLRSHGYSILMSTSFLGTD